MLNFSNCRYKLDLVGLENTCDAKFIVLHNHVLQLLNLTFLGIPAPSNKFEVCTSTMPYLQRITDGMFSAYIIVGLNLLCIFSKIISYYLHIMSGLPLNSYRFTKWMRPHLLSAALLEELIYLRLL